MTASLLLALTLAAPFPHPSDIVFKTADNKTRALAATATAPTNLLLIVNQQEDLPSAFRWLTLPEEENLRIHIVIATPSDSAIKAKTIRLAAKRHITSSYSKQRILFASTEDITRFLAGYGLPATTQTIALRKDLHLIWSSLAPPSEADIAKLSQP